MGPSPAPSPSLVSPLAALPAFGWPLVALVAGLLVLVFWWLGAARRLKLLRAAVRSSFAAYHDRLQQRLVLGEQMAACAAQPLRHERQAIDQLTQARVSAAVAAAAAASEPGQPLVMGTLAAAERRLVDALRRTMTLADAYPDLKNDPQVQALIESLHASRAPLSADRQAYDAAVATYNAAVTRVPAVIVARVLRMQPLAGLAEAQPIDAAPGTLDERPGGPARVL